MPSTVIEVAISDWEIECCAPPPMIGGLSSWRLTFIPDGDELSREDIWTVTHRADGGVRLDRDGFEAACSTYCRPAPPAGIHTLRGRLDGTAHGGIVPDDLPAVVGRVERIQMMSYEYERDPDEPRMVRFVPESLRLRDVRESPRWFNEGCGVGIGRRDKGLLLHLAVRRR
jgi:hypothetical protein